MRDKELDSDTIVAFKLGARARKFALEGCPVEGFELLLTAERECRDSRPELCLLLKREIEKYERRLDAIEEGD